MIDSAKLSRLFQPESIAVVGASADPTRIGGRPIHSTLQSGFEGRIIPVNPKYREMYGLPCVADLLSCDASPDLVVVAVGRGNVLATARDAISVGAGALVVFSSGFGELDEAGAREQANLAATCEAGGLIMLGPNCLGLINVPLGVRATFTAALESGEMVSGTVGFACQSGAFGSYFIALARAKGVGLKYWVATGNEAQITVADCIAYMARDPEVKVISGYIEGPSGGNSLIEALGIARQYGKPVVLLKAGRSEAGARAALSHTGSMVGDDAVFDAVFSRYGVYRARDLEDLLDVTQALSYDMAPHSRRSCVLTVSGGVGIMMADEAAQVGLQLPLLSEGLQEDLKRLVPFAGLENPVDFTGQFLNDPTIAAGFLSLVANSGEFDSIVIFLGHTTLAESVAREAVEAICRVTKETGLAVIFSGMTTPLLMERLMDAKVPVLENPIRAVQLMLTLAQMAEFEDWSPLGTVAAVSFESPRRGDEVLNERSSLALFSEAGIQSVITICVTSAEQAGREAERLGYPLVMKAEVAGLTHKSDRGGVIVALGNKVEVENAFDELLQRLGQDGVPFAAVIQPMVRSTLEVILGARRDPSFGPVVMVGSGGVLAETIHDVTVGLAVDLGGEEALDMVSRTAVGRSLLPGGRFYGLVEPSEVARSLVRLAALISGSPWIIEAEINPLLLSKGSVLAVDGLVLATPRESVKGS